jgi:hypothetical protein
LLFALLRLFEILGLEADRQWLEKLVETKKAIPPVVGWGSDSRATYAAGTGLNWQYITL